MILFSCGGSFKSTILTLIQGGVILGRLLVSVWNANNCSMLVGMVVVKLSENFLENMVTPFFLYATILALFPTV
jgi:hypothetical protein